MNNKLEELNALKHHLSNIIYNFSQDRNITADNILDVLIRTSKFFNDHYNSNIDIQDFRNRK